MEPNTNTNLARRQMSRDIFKAPAKPVIARQALSQQHQDRTKERENSVKENLQARAKYAEDLLRDRDDEIYHLNEEIHQLQNQNYEMKEKLDRYMELSGPLPWTPEAMQAMEATYNRVMRQFFGERGFEAMKNDQSEPDSPESQPDRAISPMFPTSSPSDGKLKCITRKLKGRKRRMEDLGEEEPPTKRRRDRPRKHRAGGASLKGSTSGSSNKVDSGKPRKRLVVEIDSDNEYEIY